MGDKSREPLTPISLDQLGAFVNNAGSSLPNAVAADIFRRGVAVEKPAPASSHFPEISEELRSIAHAIDYSEFPDLAVMSDRVKAVFQTLQGLLEDENLRRAAAKKQAMTGEEAAAKAALAFMLNPEAQALGGEVISDAGVVR